ncbi:MAG: symmetrical bis(5'-nucleosyl)-tetraphosphatase [Polaromonas sp.]|uniref:symmetrical bis(5'-nucleosyl)-tetraphosphatase n=1 Tax=Polaromonas sp. TaxID=1869339 RepID=UPI00272F7697|nr:symmetrical bis(5'-nucleosyl)-tetraphosphatase [Polaromonas sp.]MDP2255678.1 symmetrical bis(5'-nucleosyl)-tetraphosphatase [Polaromonas sp.]MDP3708907.1 symmetrical bis(5'-nucleosyl)-tetraphosphatase [Polaromonas sp.]
MTMYLIGDLQGCQAPFQRLLQKMDFSPSRDTVCLLGDLVNRGPDSLGVLRSVAALGDAAQCLLGNHDLHLLALWQGIRPPGRNDTLQDVLQAPDREALLDWLRQRPMALHHHGWLMVHAGVLPQWSTAQTMALAAEVEQTLRGPDLKGFLSAMYGNTPAQWQGGLTGADRLRVIVNALTRLRFCTPEGVMDFSCSDGARHAPAGFMPWFEIPGRATQGTPMAFGHWSTLAAEGSTHTGLRHNALPLDTGCVWGGCLTAARLGAVPGEFELVTVECERAQEPGKSG